MINETVNDWTERLDQATGLDLFTNQHEAEHCDPLARELTFGVLLALGFRRPGSLPAIVGAAGPCVTYLTTLSFLLTTPGVFAPGNAPILSGDVGLFLLKDIVLLAASVLLLAQGLAQRTDPGRDRAPVH